MASASKLETLFAPYGVPQALSKLARFDEQMDRTWYADGFEMYPDVERSRIDTWSTDRAFLDALFPFAMANGSGSTYALWNDGESADSSQWPVVVFGDEGGVWVVAENLIDLLALLTYDAEPMIDHESVTYYRSPKTHELSERHEDFVDWLRETFEVEPIDDADTRVEAAQRSLQHKFQKWMAAFVTE